MHTCNLRVSVCVLSFTFLRIEVQTDCWRPVIAALRTFQLADFTIVHLEDCPHL